MNKKLTEFREAAKPLIKYLCENHHPHMTVIVTPTDAQLVEGAMTIKCDEFILD